MLTNEDKQALIDKAVQAYHKAYAPIRNIRLALLW